MPSSMAAAWSVQATSSAIFRRAISALSGRTAATVIAPTSGNSSHAGHQVRPATTHIGTGAKQGPREVPDHPAQQSTPSSCVSSSTRSSTSPTAVSESDGERLVERGRRAGQPAGAPRRGRQTRPRQHGPPCRERAPPTRHSARSSTRARVGLSQRGDRRSRCPLLRPARRSRRPPVPTRRGVRGRVPQPNWEGRRGGKVLSPARLGSVGWFGLVSWRGYAKCPVPDPSGFQAPSAEISPFTPERGRPSLHRSRSASRPTVRPGREPIWRTPSSTPGMKDARS